MSIDPKIALWIKTITTILNLVVNGTITFTGLVSIQTATMIVAGCQVIITILGGVMSAYSSSQPGPLAPPDPPVVQAATHLAELPVDASPIAVQGAKASIARAIDDH